MSMDWASRRHEHLRFESDWAPPLQCACECHRSSRWLLLLSAMLCTNTVSAQDHVRKIHSQGADRAAHGSGLCAEVFWGGVQIAGLDVGWGQRIDLTLDPKTRRYVTERQLPAGRFPYRLVYNDELWTWSADHPTMKDGDHVNNYVEVLGASTPEAIEARQRIMSETGDFTAGERQHLTNIFAKGQFRDC